MRGLTSNPSIFQKAMTSGDDYDEQFAGLLADGLSVADAYWELVLTDIGGALDALAPVYERSDGIDGFVSVEVDPKLARDTEGTLAAARSLHQRVDRPNLYVKIPGTAEGLPAIEAMAAEGRSVNVTLLFSLTRYAEVIEAYLRGLEACDGDLSAVSGVASFFISRTDTEVDRRLEAIGTPEALGLRGQTAVAKGRWPIRFSPSSSPVPAGRPWLLGGRGPRGRCGLPPPPRTRLILTPCMSTSSSAPTR